MAVTGGSRGDGTDDAGRREHRRAPLFSPLPYDDAVPREALLDRIVIDPQICFGKPVVRGTRIWVGLVLGLLADGATTEDVLQELVTDDVHACVAYGSILATAHFVDVAGTGG